MADLKVTSDKTMLETFKAHISVAAEKCGGLNGRQISFLKDYADRLLVNKTFENGQKLEEAAQKLVRAAKKATSACSRLKYYHNNQPLGKIRAYIELKEAQPAPIQRLLESTFEKSPL